MYFMIVLYVTADTNVAEAVKKSRINFRNISYVRLVGCCRSREKGRKSRGWKPAIWRPLVFHSSSSCMLWNQLFFFFVERKWTEERVYTNFFIDPLLVYSSTRFSCSSCLYVLEHFSFPATRLEKEEHLLVAAQLKADTF